MIELMEMLCCTQICVCSLQISHSVTPRDLEDAIIRVAQSYVPIDFVVLETGRYVKAPIILG